MTAQGADESYYAISYERAAAKELSKLDKQTARRIIRSINDLRQNPHPPGCRQLVGYDRLWRIRVGDYRVVYFVDGDTLIVLIVRVAHRREVYRPER